MLVAAHRTLAPGLGAQTCAEPSCPCLPPAVCSRPCLTAALHLRQLLPSPAVAVHGAVCDRGRPGLLVGGPSPPLSPQGLPLFWGLAGRLRGPKTGFARVERFSPRGAWSSSLETLLACFQGLPGSLTSLLSFPDNSSEFWDTDIKWFSLLESSSWLDIVRYFSLLSCSWTGQCPGSPE